MTLEEEPSSSKGTKIPIGRIPEIQNLEVQYNNTLGSCGGAKVAACSTGSNFPRMFVTVIRDISPLNFPAISICL